MKKQQHTFKDRYAFGHNHPMCGQGFLEWYAGLVVSLNTHYQACAMAKFCGKIRYWQEPWLPNHKVQWNMTLSNTDQVKDLRYRGDVGVRTQPDPMKLLFQSRPPLPTQRQSRINSMILCQVHMGHNDKDKECRPSNLPQYCTEHGSKVSCELT
jgi:hypothetical protein